MSWSCGIVGLPNAGKSTLFKALTNLDVTIESYPFSTIDPNKAVVPIPDERLAALAEVCGSEKITPSTLEIIDVAGLVKGASKGEGLGNQFLGHLRNVDLMVHVVAGFKSMGKEAEDPVASIEAVNLELCLADIEIIERRRAKLEPKVKSGDKNALVEVHLLDRLEHSLNRGLMLYCLHLSGEDRELLAQLSLLTLKEMVYVYNLDEGTGLSPDLSCFPVNNAVVPMFARLESELAALADEEKKQFLEAYGLVDSQTEKLLDECYNRLDLFTFYTVKGTEARAWVAPKGIRAVKAAGRVHTDMEKGFINAEVVAWDKLLEAKSLNRVREKGLCRIEGRDYQVKDGDVLFFRFRNPTGS